jgi:hypothetical protein
MANTRYYVVEARLPVEITEAVSVEEAARKAARRIENEYGVNISNWYLRVFVYGGEVDEIGPVEEWFSNPSGSKFRNIESNIERHFELFEKGETPQGE